MSSPLLTVPPSTTWTRFQPTQTLSGTSSTLSWSGLSAVTSGGIWLRVRGTVPAGNITKLQVNGAATNVVQAAFAWSNAASSPVDCLFIAQGTGTNPFELNVIFDRVATGAHRQARCEYLQSALTASPQSYGQIARISFQDTVAISSLSLVAAGGDFQIGTAYDIFTRGPI